MSKYKYYCKDCKKYHTEHNKGSHELSKTPKLMSDNYVMIKQIGSGSFGEVYMARNKNGIYVAAKVEKRNKSSSIYYEYRIYKQLQKDNFKEGLPTIFDYIETSDYNILFMQLLGSSLDDLFNKYNKKFNLATVFLLADQLLILLEQLHTSGYIHRDIKPNNFLVGKDGLQSQLFITDFGLSKKYINDDQKHISFKNNRSLIGTARYASVNMHMGMEPSRRDDLESVGYMLVYFLKGSLPWQGIKNNIKKNKHADNIEAIGEVKMCTSLDKLCSDLPSCFKDYLKYCRHLKFDEAPDYEYLRNLFRTDSLALKTTPYYQWC